MLFHVDSCLQYGKEKKYMKQPEAFAVVSKLFILKLTLKKLKYSAYIHHYLKIKNSQQEKSEELAILTLYNDGIYSFSDSKLIL